MVSLVYFVSQMNQAAVGTVHVICALRDKKLLTPLVLLLSICAILTIRCLFKAPLGTP